MINVVNTALRSSMYRHKEQSYLHFGDRNRDRGAVCRVGGGGGGGGASQLKKFVEQHSGEKIFSSLSRGSGSMLPQKILKIKYLRLAKNAFPKIFQLIFLVFQER